MPEFQLDTSGTVPIPGTRNRFGYGVLRWGQLDAFTKGYVEALFFTEEERLCEESNGDRRMPDVAINTATMESQFVGGDSFGFSDLAPETLVRIIADCEAFQKAAAALLEDAYQRDYDAEQAGRDFWFTRNGHGVGFWDREALKPDSAEYERLTTAMVEARRSNGDWDALLSQRKRLEAESLGARLSALCGYGSEAFGSLDVYLGDDGKVHLS